MNREGRAGSPLPAALPGLPDGEPYKAGAQRSARPTNCPGSGSQCAVRQPWWVPTNLTDRRGLFLFLLLTAGAVLTPAARAVLPEPGARIYGTVATNGVMVTSANTSIFVEARRTPTGAPVASYQMGSLTNAGNFYSLKVHGEDIAPLSTPENVLLGTTLYLVLRDSTTVLDQKTFTLSSRGLSTRIDFGSLDTDANGMSDAFELQSFGSATGNNPTADPDQDGRPNLREFLQGTNPNVADGRFPADISPADDRITLNEVTDYILAWKTGGTWPVEPALNASNIVDYITRAGALWKGGEVYAFDNVPTTNAPMWWKNTVGHAPASLGARLASLGSVPSVHLRVERSLPAAYLPGQALTVAVDATPSDHTLAYALVESPPAGWVVRNVSHEGRWDAANHQVKWGPYFDQTARHLTYDAVPGPAAQGVAEFGGRGSFDGYGFPAGGPLTVWPPGKTPSPRLAAAVVASGVNVEFHGEPGRRYELQSSEDLGTWNMGPTVTLDAKGLGSAPTDAQMGARFFRLRPID